MKVIIKKTSSLKNQASQKQEPTKYGVWGKVVDVNSITYSVDVELTNGIVLKEVAVANTGEWTCPRETSNGKKYIAGERKLPPQGSYVFVLLPTGSFDGAFVLCSGLSHFDDKQKETFLATDTTRNEKNTICETVYQGNWHRTYNYKTGGLTLKSPNEKINISINDDAKNNEIKIEAYGTNIEIDKDGNITIKAKKGANLNLNGDNNSGLVKANELKTQLDKMTARIDGIINALKNAPITPEDGGATFKAGIVGTLSGIQAKENFSNIKSKKVMHGE